MKKPDSLRAAITARNPDLKKNPEKLALLIRDGTVSARYSEALKGYAYRYPLNIIVVDFSGPVDQIVMPIMLWLKQNQPDVLLNHTSADEALRLSVDFTDNKTVDLDITINLTEAVSIMVDGAGFKVGHVPEPPIAGTETFADVPPMTALDFLASIEAQPETEPDA